MKVSQSEKLEIESKIPFGFLEELEEGVAITDSGIGTEMSAVTPVITPQEG